VLASTAEALCASDQHAFAHTQIAAAASHAISPEIVKVKGRFQNTAAGANWELRYRPQYRHLWLNQHKEAYATKWGVPSRFFSSHPRRGYRL